MTPFDRRAEHARLQRLRSAIALLESNPEYPGVVVQISDKAKELGGSISEEAKRFGSQARMDYLVKMFDISAQAFLRLVSDLETQKAFAVVLDDCFRQAWERFIGHPFDLAPPIGNVAMPIQQRARHWMMEGYRHLDTLRQAALAAQSNPPAAESVATRREAFILPILERLGMSRSKWASEAGVDPSVVYDYLSGKSDPRQEIPKAMAEAIDLKPSDLPR